MTMPKKAQQSRTAGKNEPDLEYEIGTLLVVNLLQLVGLIVYDTFRYIRSGILLLCGGIGFFVVGVLKACVKVISLFLSFVHFIAAALSVSIVGIVAGIFSLVFFFFKTTWRTLFFVCIELPIFFGKKIFYILAALFSGIRDSVDDGVGRVCSMPERTVERLATFRSSFEFPVHWYRRLAGVMVVGALLTLPFPAIHSFQLLTEVRADTTSYALSAIDRLQEAKKALEDGAYDDAKKKFIESREDFARATTSLSTIPQTLRTFASLVPVAGKKVSDADRLLRIGADSAEAGIRLTAVVAQLAKGSVGGETLYPTLVGVFDSLEESFHYLADARTLSHDINPANIPEGYRHTFEDLVGQLDEVVISGERLIALKPVLLSSLGAEQKRRYLLLFQNNTEIRPTGGFLGSYALIDVLKGKLVNVEIPGGGSYDLQGSLKETVQSPFPLHIVKAEWQFQDANWFPDFPTSAKKILWFYEKSGGPTVDGLIAINATFFEKLLGVIGEITMEGYDKQLDANNFIRETQKAVELEYDKKENKPKQFIADLFPKTLEKMGALPQDQLTSVLALLFDSFARRDIQVYLSNKEEEDHVQNLGIGGEVHPAPLDFLMFVEANVGGGKGESAIFETITRDTVFNADGTIDVALAVHRAHHGKIGDPFTGVRNTSYVRFYLPKGTRARTASGFISPDPALFKTPPEGAKPDEFLQSIEGSPALDPTTGMVVTSEFGATVFGHWITLMPGQETTARATFRLPFTVSDIPKDKYGRRLYTLLIQRQSGSPINSFDMNFESKGDVAFMKTYPDMVRHDDRQIRLILDPFSRDQTIGITLSK